MGDPHTFRVPDETWAAFVAKCDERGIAPATKVAELVTGWATIDWPDGSEEWTP